MREALTAAARRLRHMLAAPPRTDARTDASDEDALRAQLAEALEELEARRKQVRRLRRRVRDLEYAGLDDLPEPVARVARAVRDEHLTFLGARPLGELAHAVVDVEADGIPGILVECGTARGGSAIVMAAAKRPGRELFVYDVFGLIPPPSDDDGTDVHARYDRIVAGEAKGPEGEVYYGYRDDLYDEVRGSFERHGLAVEEFGVTLVRGLFQDTITGDEPVALAHLDGDWYESTRTCLERIASRVVPGGRLVIDDYYAWSGCRKAVDEFLATDPGFVPERHSRLHLVRK